MDESADCSFEEKSNTFVSWLKHNGATISPSINIADLRTRRAGRGVVATKDVAEDEELFAIPRSLIFTAEASDLPPSLQAQLSDPWLSLITAMVYQFKKCPVYFWKPYFDLLPSQFDTLMFWSDSELALLRGSAVLDKIGKENADESFEQYVCPLLATELADADIPELKALCHRMGSTIMSYAFDIDGDVEQDSRGQNSDDGWEVDDDEGNDTTKKGMIPFADLLNADAHRNNAKLFYEDDKVVMKAISPISAGTEILNDYGPLPRADLLRRYGYITDNYAAYDVVEVSRVMIQEVVQSSNLSGTIDINARVEHLQTCNLLDDAYDIGRASQHEAHFPPELCLLLNVLTATSEEFQIMKTKGRLPKSVLTITSEELLYSILVHRGAAFPDDNDIRSTDEISPQRLIMATAVIDGEKLVLKEAADALIDLQRQRSGKRKSHCFEDDVRTLRRGSKK